MENCNGNICQITVHTRKPSNIFQLKSGHKSREPMSGTGGQSSKKKLFRLQRTIASEAMSVPTFPHRLNYIDSYFC